jgi:hypothetical protein
MGQPGGQELFRNGSRTLAFVWQEQWEWPKVCKFSNITELLMLMITEWLAPVGHHQKIMWNMSSLLTLLFPAYNHSNGRTRLKWEMFPRLGVVWLASISVMLGSHFSPATTLCFMWTCWILEFEVYILLAAWKKKIRQKVGTRSVEIKECTPTWITNITASNILKISCHRIHLWHYLNKSRQFTIPQLCNLNSSHLGLNFLALHMYLNKKKEWKT